MSLLPRRTRTVPSAILAVALLSIISCANEEKKNYAVPHKLCGVPVDPELLEPLLPGGEAISTEPWSQLPSCRITIDSTQHANMMVSANSRPWNPVDYTTNARNLEPDQVSEWDVEDGGVIWLADELSGASIAFPCPYEERESPYGLFDLSIGGAGQIDDEEERAERIKEFSLNYLEGIKRTLCNK